MLAIIANQLHTLNDIHGKKNKYTGPKREMAKHMLAASGH